MSRFMQAIEEAESTYLEEIGELRAQRDNLMEELRATRQQLTASVTTCSRNTYMLGWAITMLRERGVSDEEIKKTLGIVGQPEIENELRPSQEVMDLLRQVGAPKTISTQVAILVTDKQIADLMAEAAEAGDLDQVALCNEALAGSQGAREECAKVIHNARMANTDKETPTDGS